jgi:hypothetical protein
VSSRQRTGTFLGVLFLVAACNSDIPVPAVAVVTPPGAQVTVTRVATHPFLSRFNLKLSVSMFNSCLATSDLFPDTGGVSRRNVYTTDAGLLYVVGQFDVRRFDAQRCRIELVEFQSLEPNMRFVGSFDLDDKGSWTFLPAYARAERPFEKL